MTEIKEIQKLVSEELKTANSKYPLFHSDHEAWAVMMEEVVEAKRELDRVCELGETVFDYVMADEDPTIMYEQIYKTSLLAIAETIQIAAMANKAKMSRKEGIKIG